MNKKCDIEFKITMKDIGNARKNYNSFIKILKDKVKLCQIASDQLKEIIRSQLTDSIVNVLNNSFGENIGSTDKDIIAEQLASAAGVIFQSGLNESALDAAIVQIDSSVKVESYNSEVNNIFGYLIGVNQYRLSEFATEVAENVIANITRNEKGEIIDQKFTTNNKELNAHIKDFKERLFKTIVDYLKDKGVINEDFTLYNEKGQFNETTYDKIMRIAKSEITKISSLKTVLYNEWQNKYTKNGSTQNLDFVNAYLNLVDFDKLLRDTVGSIVQIDEKLKSNDNFLNFSGVILEKYSLGKDTSHLVKHFATESDWRNSINESSKLATLLLSTITIMDLDGKTQGRSLTPSDVINSWLAIRKILLEKMPNAIVEKFGVKESISTLIYKSYNNPDLYIPIIFEYLFSSRFDTDKKLKSNGASSNDINILYSFYERGIRLYKDDISSKTKTNYSSYLSSEISQIKEGKISPSLLYSGVLLGLMHRSAPAAYLSTTRDDEWEGLNTAIIEKNQSKSKLFDFVSTRNSKFYSDQFSKEQRQKLLDKYSYDYISPSEVSVVLGNIRFSFNNKGTSSNVNLLSNSKSHIETDSKVIYKGEELNLIKFLDDKIENIYKALEDPEIKDIVESILDLIRDTLDLPVNYNSGKDILQQYLLLGGKLSDILKTTLRVLRVNQIYKDYFTDKESKTENPPSFQDWLINKQLLNFSKNRINYNQRGTFIDRNANRSELKSVLQNTGWIDLWFDATDIYNGESSKATQNNILNNKVARARPLSLAAKLQTLIQEIKDSDSSAEMADESLLFVIADNRRTITDFAYDSDLSNLKDEKNVIKSRNATELLYHSIVHNFFNAWVQLGKVLVQPTAVADKTSIPVYGIKIDSDLKYGDKQVLQIKTATNDQLIECYFKTVGNFYRKAYQNVLNDWKKLYPELSDEYTINEKLKTLTEEQLIKDIINYNNNHKENPIKIIKEQHYLKTKQGLKLNDSLYTYYSYQFSDINNLKERLNIEMRNFIQEMLNQNVNIYAYHHRERNEESNSPVARFIRDFYSKSEDQVEYYKNWTIDGRLIIAKTASGNELKPGDEINNNEQIVVNPLLEKYFYSDLLLSANLKYLLVGSETVHKGKSNISSIIKEYSAELNKVGLDPNVLQNYDLIDLNLLINSENKNSKKAKLLKEIRYKAFINFVASSESTQYKRNAAIPATGDAPDPTNLFGLPEKLKFACTEDVSVDMYTINGDIDEDGTSYSLDVHDGSSSLNTLGGWLESASLDDKQSGADIGKTIGVYKDHYTGVNMFLKHAAHGVTNGTMRTTLGSPQQDYLRFKQYNDLKWEEGKYDLCNSVKNRPKDQQLHFKSDIVDSLSGGQGLYYESDGVNYKITDFTNRIGVRGEDGSIYFTLEETFPSGVVQRVAHLFNKNSEHIRIRQKDGQSDKDFYKEVKMIKEQNGYESPHSLFQIWKVFGGMYSKSLQGGILDWSENSIQATARLTCFVNEHKKGKEKEYTQDQNTFYQPLKYYFIYLNGNATAFKSYQANINPRQRHYDGGELGWFEVPTVSYSQQLDPDHEAEDSTIHEFTQVIASLDAGGAAHKLARRAFQDLQKVALHKMKDSGNALINYIKSSISESGEKTLDQARSLFYDTVTNAFIKNSRSRKDSVIVDLIYENLRKAFKIKNDHINDKVKNPVSDPSFFKQTITGFITELNKAIKREYTGIGAVLVPSYDRFTIYDINGETLSFNDILRKAKDAGIDLSEEYFDDVSKNQALVKKWLNQYQDSDELNPEIGLDKVKPASNIIINGQKLNTNTIDNYYHLKAGHWIWFSSQKEEIFKQLGFDVNLLTDKKRRRELYNILTNLRSNLTSLEQFRSDPFINLYFEPLIIKRNVMDPRNLAPSQVSWNKGETEYNVFDLDVVKEAYFGNRDQKAIDEALYKVEYEGVFTINGETLAIDPGTLVVKDPEIIMSNIYKNIFGKGSDGINQTQEKLHARSLAKIDVEDTSLIFTTNTGNTTCISFEKPKKPKTEWDESYLEEEIDKHGNKNFYVRLPDGERLFYAGAVYDSLHIYDENTETIYKLNPNNEREVEKDSNYKVDANGKVYRLYQFITEYSDKKSLFDGSTIINRIYHIDRDELRNLYKYRQSGFNEETTTDDINKFFENEENLLKLDNGVTRRIGKLLYTIYQAGDYTGFQLNKKLNSYDIPLLRDYLANMSSEYDEVEYELNNVSIFNKIRTFNYQFLDSLTTGLKLKGIVNLDTSISGLYSYYKDYEVEVKKYLSERLKTSFELSKYFVCARIPAQTLQSYMAMKCVDFYPTIMNRAAVSHLQMFLQGSDFDIDKSYIMGFEFKKDGTLLEWSNLFDYSSIDTLQASLWLPMPNNVQIESSTLEESDINVSEQVSKINQLTTQLTPANIENYNKIKAEIIKIKADILDSIDKYAKDGKIKVFGLTNDLLKELQLHENFKIAEEEYESVIKNSIAGKIGHIIRNVANYSLANSPVTMATLNTIKTPKGNLMNGLTGINPFTKFIVQHANMEGKDTISIYAVGEKILMGLYEYFNESVLSKDKDYAESKKFLLQYNRIQGRYSGNIETAIKTEIADINTLGLTGELKELNLAEKANQINLIHQQIERQYIEEKNVNISNLTEQQKKELAERKDRAVINSQSSTPHVDLMLSQLLSAATDNAKHLILSRINGGTEYAKMFIHLLILGFNIKDVVSFMTSPAVSVIDAFSKANMFDEYVTTQKLDFAINKAKGHVHVNTYITVDEKESGFDSDYLFYSSVRDAIYKKLNLEENIDILKKLKASVPEEFEPDKDGRIKPMKLQKLFDQFVQMIINGDNTIYPFLNDISFANKILSRRWRALLDDVYYTTKTIVKAIKEVGKDNYYKDVEEFDKIFKDSDETSNIGRYWFGLNQGIPNDLESILNRLNTIEEDIFTKESELEIDKRLNKRDKSKELQKKIEDLQNEIKDLELNWVSNYKQQHLRTSDEKINDLYQKKLASLEDRLEKLKQRWNRSSINLEQFISKIVKLKPYYTEQYIRETLEKASELGILHNFDIESYLYNIDSIQYKGKKYSYREVAIDYYNLLKRQYNILDIMERNPQYQACLEALKIATGSLIYSNYKGMLLGTMRKLLKQSGVFLNDKVIKNLFVYAEELMLQNWLNQIDTDQFTIGDGDIYYDKNFDKHISKENKTLDLKTSHNRATFKVWVERTLIPKILSGEYNTAENDFSNNYFLKRLVNGKDLGKIIKKLDIRVSEVEKSYTSQLEKTNMQIGLQQLTKLEIPVSESKSISVADILTFYSLLTSLNHFGNEKLTAIFDILMDRKNSLYQEYYKFIGEQDFPKGFSTLEDRINLLRELGFNVADAEFKIAPLYSSSNYQNAKERVIVVNDEGKLIYKRKRNGSYQDEHIFADGDTDERIFNVSTQGLLFFPNANTKKGIKDLIDSVNDSNEINLSDFLAGLKDLIKLGYIRMDYNC